MVMVMDIIFNSSKSQMMIFDTRKIGHTVDFSIGSSIMNETRYLNKLFSCYCSTVHLCSLWVKLRKSVLKRFVVACIQ